MSIENQGPKLIKALESYQDALERLGEDSCCVQNWIYEARHGRVTSPRFREWLGHQADYWGEKDRRYAAYLRSLATT